MQNISNSLYINNKKVINLKSELLFREAEDDFFYFNKINSALKKLEAAIKLTPSHFKSLMLCADICFMKGNIKKALMLYKSILENGYETSRCFAALANCFFVLKDFEEALKWLDKAVSSLKSDESALLSQLLEIKINILVEMKQYKQAYIVFIQAQNLMDTISLRKIYSSDYDLINEKIKLQKKLKQSRLKIV